MALNSANVIVPGRGAVFTAAVNTAPPAYKTMTAEVPGTGWTCLGHTSKDNGVSLSKEGGDTTQFDSWWSDALSVVRGSNTWSVSVNALQIDAGVLDLAFSGTPAADGYVVPASVAAQEKAMFILALQGTVRMGIYLPKVSISLGDAPSFDPSSLLEVPLTGAVLAGTIGGNQALMKWYHAALETP